MQNYCIDDINILRYLFNKRLKNNIFQVYIHCMNHLGNMFNK